MEILFTNFSAPIGRSVAQDQATERWSVMPIQEQSKPCPIRAGFGRAWVFSCPAAAITRPKPCR